MSFDFDQIILLAVSILRIVIIAALCFSMVPLLVWLERRVSAFMQNRLGPNRVGPFGLFQLIADFIKFITKEDFAPGKASKLIFYLAPILALIPGAVGMMAIPLSSPVEFAGQSLQLQGFDIPATLICVLGFSSLGVYSVLLAGWSSGSKYSLLGGLRAAAQVISYELPLGLSLVGVLLLYGSMTFSSIIESQQGVLSFALMGSEYAFSFLPNWGIFYQPFAALFFFIAALAESHRIPFDLPEAESELVAGYQLEYGGLKMLLFYMGEYVHMILASALMVTLFFGGYQLPFITAPEVASFVSSLTGFSTLVSQILTAVFHNMVFMFKVMLFLFLFIWIRWSLPRFRYDQLMDLGWKKLLPLTLANAMLTAFIMLL